MEETTWTTHLPGLDVEITRWSLAPEQAEILDIRLRATPTFEAVGRWLSHPQVALAFWLASESLALWAGMWEGLWQPWLSLAATLPEPLPRKAG